MKVNNRRRAGFGKRTASIIALCAALVLTLVVGYLGFNGMPLDSRGLYRLVGWIPTTDVENWPKPI